MLENGEIVLPACKAHQVLELLVGYDGAYTEFEYRVCMRVPVWYVFSSLLMTIIGENNHYLQHRGWRTRIRVGWHHPCHCPIGCDRVKRFPRIMVISSLYTSMTFYSLPIIAASFLRLKYPAMAKIQSGYWTPIFYHHALMLLKNPTRLMIGIWYVYDWAGPSSC